MLRDHPFCGPAATPDERRREIVRGKEVVEEVFGRRCLGLRPGCGFPDGLHGDAELVETVASAGYRYTSALLWGPEFTLPAPPRGPEDYAAEGHPDLIELPGHGWHENVLKAHNLTTQAKRILLWPMPIPEAVPTGPIETHGRLANRDSENPLEDPFGQWVGSSTIMSGRCADPHLMDPTRSCSRSSEEMLP